MTIQAISRSWTVPALAVGAALAYAFLGLIPDLRQFQRMRQDLEMKRGFVAQAASLETSLAATSQELEKTVRYNRAWEEGSPRPESFPRLLGQINTLALQAGVTPTRIDPDPVQDQSRVGRIPLVICCQGNFKQTFQFLQAVESLPFTSWTKDLRLEVDEKNGEAMKVVVDLEIFAEKSESSDQVDRSK